MARATRVVDGGETPFKGAAASTSPTGTCPFIVAACIPKSRCKRNSTISMLAVVVLMALLTSLKAASTSTTARVPSTLWLLHASIAALTWLHRLLPIGETVLPWPLRQLLFSQLVLAWLLWLLPPLPVRQVMIATIPLVSVLCAFKYPTLLILRLRLLCILLLLLRRKVLEVTPSAAPTTKITLATTTRVAVVAMLLLLLMKRLLRVGRCSAWHLVVLPIPVLSLLPLPWLLQRCGKILARVLLPRLLNLVLLLLLVGHGALLQLLRMSACLLLMLLWMMPILATM